jgi:hypothetical protein
MELICLSDLHGRIDILERMRKAAGDADVLIVAGDITNFGKRGAAEEIVEKLLKINDTLLAVPGNCDTPEVNDVLEEYGVSIHGKGALINGVAFFGLGGSGVTPFSTPQEYREEKLEELLRMGYERVKMHAPKVLVSHSPPLGTKADLTGSGIHAGSSAVKSFIEGHRVSLVVCGHIHEARGTDAIGDTWIVNPGPAHMGYARISLGDEVRIELIRL